MTSPADITRVLGDRIRSSRIAANLTQAELAELLGYSTRTLQDWESGAAFPRASARRRIAEWLQTVEQAA